MPYLDYLQRRCTGLNNEQRLGQCALIYKTLAISKCHEEVEEMDVLNDLYFFVVGSRPPSGSQPVSSAGNTKFQKLIEAAQMPNTCPVRFNHAPTISSKLESYRARIAAYEARIQRAWGLGSYEVLPVDMYQPTKPLSKHSMELLCKLAEHTDLPAGRSVILGAIETDGSDHLRPKHLRDAAQQYAPDGGYARGPRSRPFITMSKASSVHNWRSEIVRIRLMAQHVKPNGLHRDIEHGEHHQREQLQTLASSSIETCPADSPISGSSALLSLDDRKIEQGDNEMLGDQGIDLQSTTDSLLPPSHEAAQELIKQNDEDTILASVASSSGPQVLKPSIARFQRRSQDYLITKAKPEVASSAHRIHCPKEHLRLKRINFPLALRKILQPYMINILSASRELHESERKEISHRAAQQVSAAPSVSASSRALSNALLGPIKQKNWASKPAKRHAIFQTSLQGSTVDPAVLRLIKDITPETARHRMASLSDHETLSPVSIFDGSGDDDNDPEAMTDHANTVNGGAGSIERRLNDEQISNLISRIDLGSCVIVDSCQVGSATAFSMPPSRQRTERAFDAPLIFLPYNDIPESDNSRNNHWSLGVFHSSIRLITYYDSCTYLQVAKRAEPALRQTLSWLLTRDLHDVGWQEISVCQQSNAIDCGAFLIENLRSVVTCQPLPKTIDSEILQQSLAIDLEKVKDTQPSAKDIMATIRSIELELTSDVREQGGVDRELLEMHTMYLREVKPRIQNISGELAAQVQEEQQARKAQNELHRNMILQENVRLYLELDIRKDRQVLDLQQNIPSLPEPSDPYLQACNVSTMMQTAVQDILRKKESLLQEATSNLVNLQASWRDACAVTTNEILNTTMTNEIEQKIRDDCGPGAKPQQLFATFRLALFVKTR
ncbi:MAG: hypothetical protein Q9209_005856 [Squamulea sp. 1 TL-2023]